MSATRYHRRRAAPADQSEPPSNEEGDTPLLALAIRSRSCFIVMGYRSFSLRAPSAASSTFSHGSGMLLPRSDYDDPEELRQIVARFRELASELERRELQIRRGEVGAMYFLIKSFVFTSNCWAFGPAASQAAKYHLTWH